MNCSGLAAAPKNALKELRRELQLYKTKEKQGWMNVIDVISCQVISMKQCRQLRMNKSQLENLEFDDLIFGFTNWTHILER